MSLELSKRLKKIISMCDPCDTIIDVGTDHGKVAIAIANSKISKSVIATDVKKGPLNMCIENANKYLIDKKYDFRTIVSDGLKDIDKTINCGIIISGMGYDTIIDIIKDIDEYNYKYLILSPHNKITNFLRYIVNSGLNCTKISTVFEDNKAYFIFKIEK